MSNIPEVLTVIDGEYDENWYFVDGKIVKYINGKRI